MSESCFRVPRHVTIVFTWYFAKVWCHGTKQGVWNIMEGKFDLEGGGGSGCNGISKSENVGFC